MHAALAVHSTAPAIGDGTATAQAKYMRSRLYSVVTLMVLQIQWSLAGQ